MNLLTGAPNRNADAFGMDMHADVEAAVPKAVDMAFELVADFQ